jgi:acetyltransferase-like isoleucine patch superfamily enzyme
MGFGISKIIRYLSITSIILECKRLKTTYKYRKNNLILSLNCIITDSKFGQNNFLGENVSLINSSIGDYSYVNRNSKLRNTKMGKFCSIGPNVQIILGKHPFDYVSSHPVFYSNNKPFPTFAELNYIKEYGNVTIGNDVWIGEGVLIPSGVKIGNGAVVTARAVVTKDVEPYTVVGGVPAKLIKSRFDYDTVQQIEQSEWWNWDDDRLRASHIMFHKPKDFITMLKNNKTVENNSNS